MYFRADVNSGSGGPGCVVQAQATTGTASPSRKAERSWEPCHSDWHCRLARNGAVSDVTPRRLLWTMRERPRALLEHARLGRAKRKRSLARALLLSVVHGRS
jgi:hypothetical protein